MENKEIKLHVQLTEKDYLNFQSDHYGYFKSSRWWFYGVFVGIFVLADFTANGFSGIGLPSIISILVFSSVIAISIFSIRARVKSAFKSDITFQHPMDITITDEGLNINAYRANTNPIWKEVYRYSITKNTIYIYTAENKSVIIPKKFFESENDLNTVIELLKNKVDQSKYKKQSSKAKLISWIFPLIFVGICLIYVFNSGGNEKQNQAWAYEKNGDFENAIKLYDELIQSDPDEMGYYLSRANCEINASMFKQAICDCEIVIEQNPDNGQAYYYLAYALYNNRNYDEACKAIHKSIEKGYTKSDDGLCDSPEE